MPGVPILIGGCEDKTTVRALIEAGRWLSHSGSQQLQESMKLLSTEIVANGKGGEWETEKFRHNMPSNLIDFLEQRSWVSGGWTIPSGVQPFTPEVESRIVQSIVRELNCLFDLDLDMARSEEGGDLPIRRYPDGRYHIEGDLVLTSKERLFMYFRNSLPIFKLLEKFRIFFLSQMPRYL
jgi:hypothetical protein